MTVAVRRVPVLRHAQRTGTQAYFESNGWGGGLGVDSVRDGVLPDPLALSEVVGLPECCDSRLLPCTKFQRGASDSVLRRLGFQFLDKVGLPKTVWRFVEVQKTIEISQLQFIDKVLPSVVAQRQIPMVLRVQKTAKFPQLQFNLGPRQFLDKVVFMPVACRQHWGPDVQLQFWT